MVVYLVVLHTYLMGDSPPIIRRYHLKRALYLFALTCACNNIVANAIGRDTLGSGIWDLGLITDHYLNPKATRQVRATR